MKRTFLLSVLIMMAGCQGKSWQGFSTGHTLTIEKIGDGIVFPYEGSQRLSQTTVPIMAAEHYGPYKFKKYEGVDNFTTKGAYYVADVKLNKNKTVKVIFMKQKRNLEWLSGSYTLTTKGIAK